MELNPTALTLFLAIVNGIRPGIDEKFVHSILVHNTNRIDDLLRLRDYQECDLIARTD